MDRKPTLLEQRDYMWDLCYMCMFCDKCECCLKLNFLNSKLEDVMEEEETNVNIFFLDE